MHSNLKFEEFSVFPMVTYDKRLDSPIGAKWKIVVSVPSSKLEKPSTLCEKGIVFSMGDWLIVVCPKYKDLTGHEGNELTFYEASKGEVCPVYSKLGEARIKALWASKGSSLLEVKLEIDMQIRQRYPGAIVVGDNSIQVWLKLF